MRYAVCLLALAACTDGDSTDPDIDGGRPDGSIDAGRDASPDARQDDGGALDCSPLDASYKLYMEGGLSPLRSVMTISGSGAVKFESLPGGAYMDAGTYACTGSLGACGSESFDLGDFRRLLDGVSTLWGDGSTVLGEDPRPYDGQAFVIERTSDGKKIVLGESCLYKTAPCPEPRPAAESLRQAYGQILRERPLGRQSDGGLAGSCE